MNVLQLNKNRVFHSRSFILDEYPTDINNGKFTFNTINRLDNVCTKMSLSHCKAFISIKSQIDAGYTLVETVCIFFFHFNQ